MKEKLDGITQPLYAQIKEIVRKRIESGMYKVGDIIPTEPQFQEEFHVSRITVRRSMDELERDGYIERSRGRGSIVIDNKQQKRKTGFMSLSHEMEKQGIKLGTKDMKVSICEADSKISSGLEILQGDYVLKIERVRMLEDEAFAYACSYFQLEQELPVDASVYKGSLYESIGKLKGISCEELWFPKRDIISAEQASGEVAARLNGSKDTWVLKKCSQIVDAKSKVMEYSITYFLANRYQCNITYEETRRKT